MTSFKQFKVTDGVDLKEFEKFGFRKHKQDGDNVICSKWSRRWIEADTIDGYPCGSSGWEFYTHIYIYDDRTLEIYLDDGYGKCYSQQLMLFYKLVKADLIEIVEKIFDEKENK